MTPEQLKKLFAMRSQVVALTEQASVLSAQAAALQGQMESLTRELSRDIVETSGSEVAERIFKPESPRHFMEQTDAQGQESASGREASERTHAAAVPIRTTGNSGSTRDRGSDSRRQRGSAEAVGPQGGRQRS